MRSLFLKAAGCLWAFGMILWPETGVAEPAIGIGELDSLIARHPVRRNPRLTGEVLKDVVRYQSIEGAGTTAFIIPGF
ncbi:MAG: hypothetical protein GWM98_26790, partial [Nitrospinaceae bacterium]|nr:hypothetical protein [Nitrospinaceae bacterium]NIR57410.1 hypothetical protein [Nitrospinaceae bacterium]NIS87868.1 hypothetical protein [Nitrospinaceae bacterium]NIT84738.1 hypothetical protein [Nitrospinaceae bacterium]NIU46916.1 hypothetical protein [Nitrospinaceae bacterium]